MKSRLQSLFRRWNISKCLGMLSTFIQENELRSVVFHSLRHSSTSIKIQISCGNIKAVQADNGHAQARMVTEVYAHTNNEERQLLAQKVDENFFQTPTPGAFAPTSEMQKSSSDSCRKAGAYEAACRYVAGCAGKFVGRFVGSGKKAVLQKKEKILETIVVSRIFLELLGRFELPDVSRRRQTSVNDWIRATRVRSAVQIPRDTKERSIPMG